MVIVYKNKFVDFDNIGKYFVCLYVIIMNFFLFKI